MRMPTARFTIRRLMVVVVVVACILWATLVLQERRRRFLEIASKHEKELQLLTSYGCIAYVFAEVIWLDEMKKKYEYAAAHPWLSIEPDLPVPSLGESSVEPGPPPPPSPLGRSPFELDPLIPEAVAPSPFDIVDPKAIRGVPG